MKRKAIWAALFFILLFTAILTVYLLISGFFIIGTVLIALLVLTAVGFYGQYRYRKYINKRIQDPKKDLKRNYHSVIVGSQKVLTPADSDSLDLRGLERNFYVDVLLAERYYSYLAKDGVIVFCIDGGSTRYIEDRKISALDYPLLHQVTLLENGIDISSKKTLFGKIMIGYLYLIKSCSGGIKQGNKSEVDCAQEILKTPEYSELKIFCTERRIHYEFWFAKEYRKDLQEC